MEGMITVGKNNPDDEVFVFNSYLGPPRTSSEFKKNKKGSPFRQTDCQEGTFSFSLELGPRGWQRDFGLHFSCCSGRLASVYCIGCTLYRVSLQKIFI